MPTGARRRSRPAAAAAIGAAARAARSDALEPVRRSGVAVITLADEAYPSRLRRIDLPPPVLFLAGDRCVAGPPPGGRDRRDAAAHRDRAARRPAGSRTAWRRWARPSSRASRSGSTAPPHAAAVRAGTPTVAVIGGGHERLYPAAHRALARSIVERRRGRALASSRRTRSRAGARSRAGTGSSAGSRTRRSWSRPARGAAPSRRRPGPWSRGRGLHIVPGRLDDPAVAGCLAFLREAGPEARIVSGVPGAARGPRAAAPGRPAASDPVTRSWPP